MLHNPYMSPTADISEPEPRTTVRRFRWEAGCVGGLVTVGIDTLLGTLLANTALWICVGLGGTTQSCYADIFSAYQTSFSVATILGFLVQILAGVCGGFVAVFYGRRQPVALVAVVMGVVMAFDLITSVAPEVLVRLEWLQMLLGLGVRMLAILAGGWLAARLAQERY